MDIEQIKGNFPQDMTILNPFRMDKVTCITLVMRQNWLTEGFEFEANIYFKNGDTRGEQRVEGKDFGELFNKVIQFCKSL